MEENRKPGLCFISLYSYPLFNSECKSPFGGSEVRISLIARELARRGNFDVSLLVWDHGQPPLEERQGVSIYSWPGKSCSLQVNAPPRADQGHLSFKVRLRAWLKERLPLPVRDFLRFLYGIPRAVWHFFRDNPLLMLGYISSYGVRKSDYQILDEIDADVYLTHGNSSLAAEVALYCNKKGKKHIFLAGSDPDYHAGYKADPQALGIYGYGYLMNYAVESANAHIVQNESQAKTLKENYGRNSVIARNPIDLERAYPANPEKGSILWVGKSDYIKRPEILLELAKRTPQFHFTMIMSYSNQQIHHHCLDEINAMKNVHLLDYVPFHEVESYFAKAKLFINTSLFEGFPNTFLQAAKYGLPVVSFQVDPGEMLSKHGCGYVCEGNMESLFRYTNDLMLDEALYQQFSERIQQYVQQYHDKDTVVDIYEGVIHRGLNDERL